MKSVLVMAGSLKRENPDLDEDVVLIRAMRDSNLPKFLVDDVELFQNIISDLFPGVVVPSQARLFLAIPVLLWTVETLIQKVCPFRLELRCLQRVILYFLVIFRTTGNWKNLFGGYLKIQGCNNPMHLLQRLYSSLTH